MILEEKGAKADADGFSVAGIKTLQYRTQEKDGVDRFSLKLWFNDGAFREFHGEDAEEIYKKLKTSFAEVVKLT